MENIIEIEDYIHNNPNLHIGSHRKSPMASVAVLVCSIALVAVAQMINHHDSLQMSALSAGVAGILAGAIMLMLCFGKGANYVYSPTKSPMRRYRLYISSGNRQQMLDLLSAGDMGRLKAIRHEVSTNTMVDVLISKDGACALLQVKEYGTTFEPVSPVCQVTGDGVQQVKLWLSTPAG